MAEEVSGHRDRLVPFAVINPFYAGWRDDLKICHEEFGMAGLRLYPKWHNYSLASSCCRELVDAATERSMAISIPIRAEDSRGRSWLVDVPDVPLQEIVELVKAHPNARFILLNGVGYTGCPLGQKGSGLPSNYAIELSRLSAVLADEIGQLIANLGVERCCSGPGCPSITRTPHWRSSKCWTRASRTRRESARRTRRPGCVCRPPADNRRKVRTLCSMALEIVGRARYTMVAQLRG